MVVNSCPNFAFYYTACEVLLCINSIIIAVVFNLKKQSKVLQPFLVYGSI